MTENYKQFVNDHKVFFDQNYDELATNYRTDFMIVSSNLQKLLPNIDPETHEEVFKKMLFEQLMAQSDITLPNITEHIALEGNTEPLYNAKQKPVIFCTYHLGSYRLLASLLTRLGISNALVMSEEGIADMGEEFITLNQNVRNHYKLDNTFEIISAEKPTSVLSMIRALRNNVSLLVYIDGNKGAGEAEDSLLNIPFLGDAILTRKGIATVSSLANVAIQPVTAERKDLYYNHLIFHNTIQQEAGQPRQDYINSTTQYLFEILSQKLTSKPEQWEGWLYVHHFYQKKRIIRTPSFSGNTSTTFNANRYSIIAWQKEHFIFDRDTYFTYTISAKIFETFRQKTSPKNIKKFIDHDTLSWFFQKKIIIF